MADNSHLCMCR